MASAALDETTYHAELLESTERIAEILTNAEPALRVTTCPDWSLSDLALHVGRAHRWAQRIIETRAQEPVDISAVDLGLPATTTHYDAWLCSGATAFSAAVQSAGTRTPVWSWSDDQSVGFWLRRITHDTIIHRIDAELTVDLRPSLPPQTASDGIADLLAAITTLSTAGHPDPIFEGLRGHGETIQLQATDTADEWFVTRMPEGVRWTPGWGDADAILRGNAFDLLLALYRRIPIHVIDVIGDEPLVRHWIAHSAF
jgi:uncharacterized protein (TIGR03083 family)